MKLHDSRQLGPLVFRDPLLLCSALYFLLYFDASGFLRLGLLAAFLHECGHILVYCVFLRRFPVIEVTMTGFCMRMDFIRRLAALISRFRLPIFVWIPRFSICWTAAPSWTVGIISSPCLA